MEAVVNHVSETGVIAGEIDGTPVSVRVRKLKWKDMVEVSNDVLAVVASASKGGGADILPSADKLLRLLVSITDSQGQAVSIDEMPIDLLGKVSEVAFDLNFTSCRSSWEPLIAKVRKLLGEVAPKAKAAPVALAEATSK